MEHEWLSAGICHDGDICLSPPASKAAGADLRREHLCGGRPCLLRRPRGLRLLHGTDEEPVFRSQNRPRRQVGRLEGEAAGLRPHCNNGAGRAQDGVRVESRDRYAAAGSGRSRGFPCPFPCHACGLVLRQGLCQAQSPWPVCQFYASVEGQLSGSLVESPFNHELRVIPVNLRVPFQGLAVHFPLRRNAVPLLVVLALPPDHVLGGKAGARQHGAQCDDGGGRQLENTFQTLGSSHRFLLH